jgi:hypothetical protein
LIAYTGANDSVDAPLLAVRADGTNGELPAIRLRVGGQRYRFVQLTRFNNSAATRSFDVTADGKQIVFDRLRENSDVVLIDLARPTGQ